MPEEELRLTQELNGQGIRTTKNPKTIFIPFDMKPTDSMERLRDYHGYMIQTEIT